MGILIASFIGIFIGLFLNALLSSLLPKNRAPYSDIGLLFPFKICIFYLMIKLRKSRSKGSESNSKAGYGVASHNDQALMERPQKLSPNIKAIDAVFFSASSMDGWGLIIAMERRPTRVSSVLVYLKVPEGSILVPLQHPDAINFRAESDEEIFKAGGLSIEVIEPTKSWVLKYVGKLRHSNNKNGETYDVNMQLTWTSSLPLFDYDLDLDAWSMAKAFARETWSKEYFENLRDHHQTHYEQMGNLKGKIIINNKENVINLPAFRDHSYSHKRDWCLMHRYYFHHVFLSDGSKGVLGLVCQPSTCTRLVLGHWWTPSGEGSAVTDIDLELFEHGEGGTPPSDYAFTFKAGGRTRCVQVKSDTSAVHFLGWDWEAKFYELFVSYNVDGVKGTGICEWQYRNFNGRPEQINKEDPDWTKKLRQNYLTV